MCVIFFRDFHLLEQSRIFNNERCAVEIQLYKFIFILCKFRINFFVKSSADGSLWSMEGGLNVLFTFAIVDKWASDGNY